MDILNCFNNRILSIIYLPTEECNFRCMYCYETHNNIKNIGTPTAIKKLIEKRIQDLDYLHFGWFGGEPLLAQEIIFNILEFIKSKKKLNTKMVFESSMTTNGYLLNINILQKLVSLGVNKYQISLDGLEDIHNKTRVLKNGEGTFNVIWNNLKSIRNSNLRVSILLRVHFSADNCNEINQLINSINYEFGNDKRFTVIFKDIGHYGGANDSQINLLKNEDKKQWLYLYTQKIKNKSQLRTLEENYICYASRPNSIIIRANGDICKCTIFLNDNRNKVGYLDDDGNMFIYKDRLIPWFIGFEKMNMKLLKCPMQQILRQDSSINDTIRM